MYTSYQDHEECTANRNEAGKDVKLSLTSKNISKRGETGEWEYILIQTMRVLQRIEIIKFILIKQSYLHS